ncbi:DsbA family protein [Pseudomonas protegens]|uniref:DsbA family protein n=1 Tax=Pseudomonas protegens TaxID=380021 RepID=UPI00381BB641
MTWPFRRKLLAVIACLGVVLAAGLLLSSTIRHGEDTHNESNRVNKGPWLLGPADARWTIVEFADLECPYCKTYTPELKHWVIQQENMNLQWHHLPLPRHGPTAIEQARTVECAGVIGGGQAFWSAIDQAFQRTLSNGQGFTKSIQVEGVDGQALARCAVTNTAVKDRVHQQYREALEQGVTATPTLLIRDNITGRSIKIEGPADGTTLLSAVDWLTQVPTSKP